MDSMFSKEIIEHVTSAVDTSCNGMVIILRLAGTEACSNGFCSFRIASTPNQF